MLEHLYKKLHLIFISSIMSTITVIWGILCHDFIDNKRQNDSIFFGQLSILMICELENPEKSPLSFPTDTAFLLRKFAEKANAESVTALDQTMATTQGGILSFSGGSYDNYWGIPAIVIDKNGTPFYLSLLHQQKQLLN